MMNDRQKRVIFSFVAFLAFAISLIVVWDWQKKNNPVPTSFLVQIPPKPRPLSELKSLPNVCGDLIVRLDSDNSLNINNEKIGLLDDTDKLTGKLREVFDGRIEAAVYDWRVSDRKELSDEEGIYKRVIVKAPDSAKYEEIVRVIDAVKLSGTSDIWLQIDGNDFNWLIFEAVEPSR